MATGRLLARLASLAIGATLWTWPLPALAQEDSQQDLGAVLASQRNLSTFYGLLKDYPEVLLKLPTYEGVTIVAPSDAAFENIPGTSLNDVWDAEDPSIAIPILEYHILQGTVSTGALASGPSIFKPTLLQSRNWTNVTLGQNVILNKQPGDVIVFTSSEGARTTQTDGDIRFSGGLIHIIDNLLIPPTKLLPTLESFGLTSFLGALFAADLMPRAAEQSNVTIFAPRDEAFSLVGSALEDLDKEALTRLAGYHVVPGKVISSAELTNGTRLKTMAKAPGEGDNGSQGLTVRRAGNNLFVNSAQVIQPDILIANGVLHIIDNVLNPDASLVVPDPEAPTQGPVWPADEEDEGGAPFTSAIPCSVECPTSSSVVSRTPTSSVRAQNTSPSGNSDNAAPKTVGPVLGCYAGLIAVGYAMIV